MNSRLFCVRFVAAVALLHWIGSGPAWAADVCSPIEQRAAASDIMSRVRRQQGPNAETAKVAADDASRAKAAAGNTGFHPDATEDFLKEQSRKANQLPARDVARQAVQQDLDSLASLAIPPPANPVLRSAKVEMPRAIEVFNVDQGITQAMVKAGLLPADLANRSADEVRPFLANSAHTFGYTWRSPTEGDKVRSLMRAQIVGYESKKLEAQIESIQKRIDAQIAGKNVKGSDQAATVKALQSEKASLQNDLAKAQSAERARGKHVDSQLFPKMEEMARAGDTNQAIYGHVNEWLDKNGYRAGLSVKDEAAETARTMKRANQFMKDLDQLTPPPAWKDVKTVLDFGGGSGETVHHFRMLVAERKLAELQKAAPDLLDQIPVRKADGGYTDAFQAWAKKNVEAVNIDPGQYARHKDVRHIGELNEMKGKVQIATSSMVSHHIGNKDLQGEMGKLSRALSNDGIFLERETDAALKGSTKTNLDEVIVNGVMDQVWYYNFDDAFDVAKGSPQEMAKWNPFNYRSLSEKGTFLKGEGLTQAATRSTSELGEEGNAFRPAHTIYRKDGTDSLTRGEAPRVLYSKAVDIGEGQFSSAAMDGARAVRVSSKELDNLTDNLGKTLGKGTGGKSADLNTILRSENKAKGTVVEANAYIKELVEQAAGKSVKEKIMAGLPSVGSPDFRREIHRRLYELRKEFPEDHRLFVRDPPPPRGVTDSTFTYYTKAIEDGTGGKHQIRARTYLREIDLEKLPTGEEVKVIARERLPGASEAFGPEGLIKIRKNEDGTFTYSHMLRGREISERLGKAEMNSLFGDVIKGRAPHGEQFKLEVKTALKDNMSGDTYRNLGGQNLVQKLDVPLTPEQLEKLFGPPEEKFLPRLKALRTELLATKGIDADRVNAVMNVLEAGGRRDSSFGRLAGATRYERDAWELAVPDSVNGKAGSKIQITFDEQQAAFTNVYSRGGGLLDPVTVEAKAPKLVPETAQPVHWEQKIQKPLVSRAIGLEEYKNGARIVAEVEDAAVSPELKSAIASFDRSGTALDRNSGKFNFLQKTGVTPSASLANLETPVHATPASWKPGQVQRLGNGMKVDNAANIVVLRAPLDPVGASQLQAIQDTLHGLKREGKFGPNDRLVLIPTSGSQAAVRAVEEALSNDPRFHQVRFLSSGGRNVAAQATDAGLLESLAKANPKATLRPIVGADQLQTAAVPAPLKGRVERVVIGGEAIGPLARDYARVVREEIAFVPTSGSIRNVENSAGAANMERPAAIAERQNSRKLERLVAELGADIPAIRDSQAVTKNATMIRRFMRASGEELGVGRKVSSVEDYGRVLARRMEQLDPQDATGGVPSLVRTADDRNFIRATWVAGDAERVFGKAPDAATMKAIRQAVDEIHGDNFPGGPGELYKLRSDQIRAREDAFARAFKGVADENTAREYARLCMAGGACADIKLLDQMPDYLPRESIPKRLVEGRPQNEVETHKMFASRNSLENFTQEKLTQLQRHLDSELKKALSGNADPHYLNALRFQNAMVLMQNAPNPETVSRAKKLLADIDPKYFPEEWASNRLSVERTLDYMATNSKSEPQVAQVNWSVFNRCPISCFGCYKNFNKGCMSPELTQHVIDKVVAHGVKEIVITGGDPIHWPGLMDFVDYAHYRGLALGIDTTGLGLTEDLAKQLKGKVRYIGLPLDGTTEEMARVFRRGGKDIDIIQSTRDNMEMLSRLGIPVKVNTVVSKDTVAHLPEIAEAIHGVYYGKNGAAGLGKENLWGWSAFEFWGLRATDAIKKKMDVPEGMMMEVWNGKVVPKFQDDLKLRPLGSTADRSGTYATIHEGGGMYTFTGGNVAGQNIPGYHIIMGDISSDISKDAVKGNPSQSLTGILSGSAFKRTDNAKAKPWFTTERGVDALRGSHDQIADSIIRPVDNSGKAIRGRVESALAADEAGRMRLAEVLNGRLHGGAVVFTKDSDVAEMLSKADPESLGKVKSVRDQILAEREARVTAVAAEAMKPDSPARARIISSLDRDPEAKSRALDEVNSRVAPGQPKLPKNATAAEIVAKADERTFKSLGQFQEELVAQLPQSTRAPASSGPVLRSAAVDVGEEKLLVGADLAEADARRYWVQKLFDMESGPEEALVQAPPKGVSDVGLRYGYSAEGRARAAQEMIDAKNAKGEFVHQDLFFAAGDMHRGQLKAKDGTDFFAKNESSFEAMRESRRHYNGRVAYTTAENDYQDVAVSLKSFKEHTGIGFSDYLKLGDNQRQAYEAGIKKYVGDIVATSVRSAREAVEDLGVPTNGKPLRVFTIPGNHMKLMQMVDGKRVPIQVIEREYAKGLSAGLAKLQRDLEASNPALKGRVVFDVVGDGDTRVINGRKYMIGHRGPDFVDQERAALVEKGMQQVMDARGERRPELFTVPAGAEDLPHISFDAHRHLDVIIKDGDTYRHHTWVGSVSQNGSVGGFMPGQPSRGVALVQTADGVRFPLEELAPGATKNGARGMAVSSNPALYPMFIEAKMEKGKVALEASIEDAVKARAGRDGPVLKSAAIDLGERTKLSEYNTSNLPKWDRAVRKTPENIEARIAEIKANKNGVIVKRESAPHWNALADDLEGMVAEAKGRLDELDAKRYFEAQSRVDDMRKIWSRVSAELDRPASLKQGSKEAEAFLRASNANAMLAASYIDLERAAQRLKSEGPILRSAAVDTSKPIFATDNGLNRSLKELSTAANAAKSSSVIPTEEIVRALERELIKNGKPTRMAHSEAVAPAIKRISGYIAWEFEEASKALDIAASAGPSEFAKVQAQVNARAAGLRKLADRMEDSIFYPGWPISAGEIREYSRGMKSYSDFVAQNYAPKAPVNNPVLRSAAVPVGPKGAFAAEGDLPLNLNNFAKHMGWEQAADQFDARAKELGPQGKTVEGYKEVIYRQRAEIHYQGIEGKAETSFADRVAEIKAKKLPAEQEARQIEAARVASNDAAAKAKAQSILNSLDPADAAKLKGAKETAALEAAVKAAETHEGRRFGLTQAQQEAKRAAFEKAFYDGLGIDGAVKPTAAQTQMAQDLFKACMTISMCDESVRRFTAEQRMARQQLLEHAYRGKVKELDTPMGKVKIGIVDEWDSPEIAQGISDKLSRSINDNRTSLKGHIPDHLVDDIHYHITNPSAVRTNWGPHGHRFVVTKDGEVLGTVLIGKDPDKVVYFSRYEINVPASSLSEYVPPGYNQLLNPGVKHEARKGGIFKEMLTSIERDFPDQVTGKGVYFRADPAWHDIWARNGFYHDPSADRFLPPNVERTNNIPHDQFNKMYACGCKAHSPQNPGKVHIHDEATARGEKLQYMLFKRPFERTTDDKFSDNVVSWISSNRTKTNKVARLMDEVGGDAVSIDSAAAVAATPSPVLRSAAVEFRGKPVFTALDAERASPHASQAMQSVMAEEREASAANRTKLAGGNAQREDRQRMLREEEERAGRQIIALQNELEAAKGKPNEAAVARRVEKAKDEQAGIAAQLLGEQRERARRSEELAKGDRKQFVATQRAKVMDEIVQEYFPGRTVAQVSRSAADGPTLEKLYQAKIVKDSSAAQDAQRALVQRLQKAVPGLTPADARAMADGLVDAHSEVAAMKGTQAQKQAAMEKALAQKWKPEQVELCRSKPGLCMSAMDAPAKQPDELSSLARATLAADAAKADPMAQAEVRRILGESSPARSGDDFGAARTAAKENAKKLSEELKAMEAPNAAGAKPAGERAIADMKRAVAAAEARMKELDEVEKRVKAAAAAPVDKGTQGRGVATMLDYIDNNQGAEIALPSGKKITVPKIGAEAVPGDPMGRQGAKLAALDGLRKQLDGSSVADQAAFMAREVEPHAISRGGDFGSRLAEAKRAGTADIEKAITEANSATRLLGNDSEAARKLSRGVVGNEHQQSLLEAAGLVKAPKGEAELAAKRTAAVEAGKVDADKVAKAAQETKGRNPASGNPLKEVLESQGLKNSDKLTKDLEKAVAAFGKAEGAENEMKRLVTALQKKAASPDEFEMYRMTYARAGEVLAANPGKSPEAAWQDGIRKMLVEDAGYKPEELKPGHKNNPLPNLEHCFLRM